MTAVLKASTYCLMEECNPCGVVASRDILLRLPHNGRIRSARTALCQDTDAVEPQRLTHRVAAAETGFKGRAPWSGAAGQGAWADRLCR